MQTEENKKAEVGILEYLSMAIMIIVTLPILKIVSLEMLDSPQLRDALASIVFCTLILAIKYSIKLNKKPSFKKGNFIVLAIAYLSFCFAGKSIFFALGALVLAYEAVLVLFLDKKDMKLAYAIGASFYAYTILLFASSFVDLPLRALAGLSGEYVLNFCGFTAKVLMQKTPDVQFFLLCKDHGSFLVANQCNGFSIMSSALVLSILLSVFSKENIFIKLGYIILSFLLAYASNVLRIFTIVMLNPIVGEDNYFLMHEIVGYTSSIALLALVFFLPDLCRLSIKKLRHKLIKEKNCCKEG